MEAESRDDSGDSEGDVLGAGVGEASWSREVVVSARAEERLMAVPTSLEPIDLCRSDIVCCVRRESGGGMPVVVLLHSVGIGCRAPRD